MTDRDENREIAEKFMQENSDRIQELADRYTGRAQDHQASTDPALLEIQVQSQVYAWLSKLPSAAAVDRVIQFASTHAKRAQWEREEKAQ